MVNKITNTIKAKYYTYQRGEFLPIYSGDELLNKREFHLYKLKRLTLWVKNYRFTYRYLTHQVG